MVSRRIALDQASIAQCALVIMDRLDTKGQSWRYIMLKRSINDAEWMSCIGIIGQQPSYRQKVNTESMWDILNKRLAHGYSLVAYQKFGADDVVSLEGY